MLKILVVYPVTLQKLPILYAVKLETFDQCVFVCFADIKVKEPTWESLCRSVHVYDPVVYPLHLCYC